MKSSVKLYGPLYTLKAIGEDVWIVDGDIVEMNFKLTQVPFSTRMTVVRLNNRDLWIHSPIHLTQELKSAISWQSEIDYLPFEGSALIEESVFFHQKSRTLILTDLIENIELSKECSCWHRLLFKIGDNTYPNGHTPRDLRMTFLFHKEIARKCYQRIKGWKPLNVLFAHGKCFIGNAEDKLPQAFFWLE